MLKKHISYLFFCILLLSANSLYSQSSPNMQAFTTDDGLSGNDVRSVFQDSKGFVWAGTTNGLSRFNAYQFDVFEADPGNPDALNDNAVLAIHEDKQGIIWIGTSNGGLNKFDPKTNLFKSWKANPEDKESLSDNTIYSIAEDNAGLIWLGTKLGGLNCFNPKTEKFKSWQAEEGNETSFPSNVVWDLKYDTAKDCLWAGTGRGLVNIKEGSFKRYDFTNDVVSILLTGNRIWLGTWGSGIFEFDVPSEKIISQYGSEQGLPNQSILGIQKAEGQNLWLASYGVGLVHLNLENRKFTTYSSKNRQKDTNWGMITDQSGNLWTATFGGLLHYQVANQKGFSLFNKESVGLAFDNQTVSAIATSGLDNIWVGTSTGFYHASYNSEGNKITSISKSNLLSEGLIRGIGIAENKEVWIAVWGEGIYHVSDDGTQIIKHYERKSGVDRDKQLASEQILSIYLDSKQVLWVGSLAGLTRINTQTGEIQNYYSDKDNPSSLSDDYAYATYETRDGSIWVGTSKGLNQYNESTNSFKSYQYKTGDNTTLSHNKVKALFEDNAGNFWIGTEGGGLNLMDRQTNTFIAYNEKNGLAGNSVKGIVEGGESLWITTNKGVSSFDFKQKEFKNYDESDGLQGNDFATSATIKFPSGYIAVGGNNGFNIFHPNQLRENDYLPPVVLTSFKLLGKEVVISTDSAITPLMQNIAYAKKLDLTYEDKIIEFEFAGLNFVKPQKNQYRYKMEGFEIEWRLTGADRRFASYTNLPSNKTYTFHVQASNDDGKWNEEGTTIQIYIKPPFWEMWWFRGLVLMLIALGVFLFFKARTARLELQKKVLEIQVLERTKELQIKQEEILTQNEELHQQQEEILAQRDNIEQKNNVLVSQKQEIEKSYKNVNILADIGQELTASLDLPTVIMKTYKSVNELMDASGFGIGIFDEKQKSIVFKGYIEKGEVLPTHKSSFDPENDLASWCIKTKREIFINDLEKDYSKYIQGKQVEVQEGEVPQSLMYLPLTLQEKNIGVITVQSFDKKAYTDNEITLLRSLATYVSIAVDNAESYREVKKAHDVIKEKNKDIMDSLRYAETIQKSVLPRKATINQFVQAHFVIFKPKDVVSGDFYWFAEVEGRIFIAVVDCTGHGVPGAFMSLIGHDLLDSIIVKERVFDPAKVLELMHAGVRSVLQQDKAMNSDGMDIAIVMIEKREVNQFKTTFAGAKRVLFFTQEGEFKEEKGDRKSVGGWQKTPFPTYSSTELMLQKGDVLYLTSDGFVDQNGPNGKKYGTKKLRSVLGNICQLDMQMQYECLVNELHNHQEFQAQRDDITMFGVKL